MEALMYEQRRTIKRMIPVSMSFIFALNVICKLM